MSSKKKVLIIGLDSATWLTLDPLIERGLMPHLKSLRDGGCWGVLRSTNPPITSSGWTAMLSGVHPARHGIVGFERYDFANNRLCFARSQDVRVETIWQVLGRRGYRVAALNVPMHYPPYPVNGVMTSGYGCPGMGAEVTYPADLKDLIRRQIPDYNILLQWNVDEKDPDTFDQVVRACRRSFEHTYELAQLVTDRYGWDVMMVVSHQMDLMQHKLMGYLLPDGWEKWPRQAGQIFELFGRLDAILAKLTALASGPNDLVILASDHGQGPRRGRVRPNSILRQWGYLRQQSSLGRACRRLAEPIGSLLGRRRRRGTKRIFTAGPLDVVEMLRLDWPRTRALAAFRAHHMFVFANLRGRQPDGAVAPGAEYDHLIEDLRQRFSSLRDPERNEPVFAGVRRPEEIYGRSDLDHGIFGDLILEAAPGIVPIRGLVGRDFYEPDTEGLVRGCHRPEGLYLLHGPGVRPAGRLDADIADIAPTVYAALGEAVPEGLDGHVIREAFESLPAIRPAPAADASPPAGTSSPDGPPAAEGPARPAAAEMTRQEEELITKRLDDLGYLE